MDDSARANQSHYDNIAKNGAYGTLAPDNRGGPKSRYVAAVFDATLLPLFRAEDEPVRLLDFGCGTGIFTVQVKALTQQVVGIDLSMGLLRVAQQVATDSGQAISFVLADGAHLPLRPSAVNRIVAREVLGTISDSVLPQTLQELARVLEPGGKFYLLDQVSESPRWQRNPRDPLIRRRSVDEVLHLFRSAGFELKSSVAVRQPRFPWIYPIWFRLIPTYFIQPLARLEVTWNRRFRPVRTRRWLDALFVFRKVKPSPIEPSGFLTRIALSRIHEISESLYSEMVENDPQHTIFHTSLWLRGLGQAFGTRIKYLGLFEDEALIGVCPLFIKRIYGVTIHGGWLPQHSTRPLYPLIPSGRDTEIIHAFNSWVRQNGLSHFQLCWRGTNMPLPPRVRAEIGEIFEVKLGSSRENFWKQIHPSQRKRIRFALRQGVRVHWVHEESLKSFLSTYARLIASTWQERQGLKPSTPFEFYTSLFKQREALNLRVMAATYQGQVIAAMWLLHRNGQCCAWDGALDQAHRRLSPKSFAPVGGLALVSQEQDFACTTWGVEQQPAGKVSYNSRDRSAPARLNTPSCSGKPTRCVSPSPGSDWLLM